MLRSSFGHLLLSAGLSALVACPALADTQVEIIRDGKAEFCAVTPPGQSGFISPSGEASPHYEDQLALYEAFDCRPQPLTRDEVEAAAVSRETIAVPR